MQPSDVLSSHHCDSEGPLPLAVGDIQSPDVSSSYHSESEEPLPLAIGVPQKADKRALKFGKKDQRKHKRNTNLIRMTTDGDLNQYRPKMVKPYEKKFDDHLEARVEKLGPKKVVAVNKKGPARWILSNPDAKKNFFDKCFGEREFSLKTSNDERHQLYLAVYGSDGLC